MEQRDRCVAAGDSLRCDRRPCLLPHCDERLPQCLFGSWGFVFILQGGGLTATVSVVHVSVETRGNISVFTFHLIF